MKSFSISLLLGLMLTGCAVSRQGDNNSIGSYVPDLSPALARQIAADSVRQIESSFPAASTRLQVRQAATDSYGLALKDTLRLRGYAIQENDQQAVSTGLSPASAAQAGHADTHNVPLAYLIDQVPQPKLYRVTLYLAGQTNTRAYVAQDDKVHPAGAWVRRE